MASIQYEQFSHVKPTLTTPSKLVIALAVLAVFGGISLLVGDIEPPAPDYHGNSGSFEFAE